MPEPRSQELVGRTFEVLTPGEKFGEFQILNCLAMDMLGSFYQVRKARSHEVSSLFLLPPLVRSTAAFRERFKSYSEELIKLEHPGLLRYLREFEVRNRFAYRCEPFSGMHLGNRMEAYHREQLEKRETDAADNSDLLADHTGGLPEAEVEEVLTKVLETLGYLHQHQILHLNLNPTNIFIADNGEVKLLGYGLMEMIGQLLFEQLVSAGVPPITVGPRQIRLNTVDILSPEKRQGKECDHRSDIYAVGMAAYWMLTGRKPTRDYKPPSHWVSDIKPGWDYFVANCLERDPAQRFQSSAGALDGLRNLANPSLATRRREPREPGPAVSSVFRHIEFIPVPRPLRSKGVWTIRAYRLGVIGLFAVAMGFAITRIFELAFVDELEQRGVVAIRTPEGGQARLTLRIFPTESQVRLPAEDLSFLVREGELKLNILPGTYRLRVDAPRFHSETALVTIGRDPVTHDITLRPAWAPAEFNGLPGTQVFHILPVSAEMELLGEIDESGLLLVDQGLFAGPQTFLFMLPNHQQREARVSVAVGEVNSINAGVEPLPGALRVRSQPTGARVYRDNQLLGVTNLTLDDLPVREPFDVIVQKEGFRREGRRVTLEPNTRTILDIGELTPRAGTLKPRILLHGRPPGAQARGQLKIKLNIESVLGDEKRVYSGETLKQLDELTLSDIPEGTVTVQIIHPDYLEATQTLELADQGVKLLHFDLQPRPAKLHLQPVFDKPYTGKPLLRVDGEVVDWTPGTAVALPAGREVSLHLQAVGYFPSETRVLAGANESVDWQPQMEALPTARDGEDYQIPFTGIEMRWIPAGQFTMGSPPREPGRLPVDGPETRITISRGFWIGITEITQSEYEALMEANPSAFKGSNHPVDSVTWMEAMEFCRRLNEREKADGRLPQGYVYRLPTEAEWEYAARAGQDTPFAWGSTASPANGNFSGFYPRDYRPESGVPETHYGTVEVRRYAPNAWGLYDIHGNVREWCLDGYTARLPGGGQTDWLHSGTDSGRRMHRGGGWQDPAHAARLSARGDGMRPDLRTDTMGFRIVLAPDLK